MLSQFNCNCNCLLGLSLAKRKKRMAFLVATTSLPAVYRPNDDAQTTTAGTPHASANGTIAFPERPQESSIHFTTCWEFSSQVFTKGRRHTSNSSGKKKASLNFLNISATEDQIFMKFETYVHNRAVDHQKCIYASCGHVQHYFENISATKAWIFTKYKT